MSTLRLGVIGCGVIGQKHVQSGHASPRIDVVAVADVREDVAKSTAATCGATAYFSADALLKDDRVQAVVVALPANGRADVVIRAFQHGKHVLVEKPTAMNADELRKIIAAKGSLLAAAASSRFRFYESSKKSTEFLATDPLGPLRVLRCRAMSAAGPEPKSPPAAWRLSRSLNAGGVLVNWGVYDLDYLMGLTGWRLKPRVVLAQTWQLPKCFEKFAAPDSDAEHYLTALVRFDNGAMLTLERGETMPAATDEAWQILGDEGALRMKMTPGNAKTLLHDHHVTTAGVQTTTLWAGDEVWDTVHSGPINDFADAILDHRPPATSLEQALVIQTMCDAIYASANSGQAVEIKEPR